MSGPWYVRVGEKELGPYTIEKLRAAARQGKIDSKTLIRPVNGQYVLAGSLPDLAFGTSLRPARVPSPPPLAPPEGAIESLPVPGSDGSSKTLLLAGGGALAGILAAAIVVGVVMWMRSPEPPADGQATVARNTAPPTLPAPSPVAPPDAPPVPDEELPPAEDSESVIAEPAGPDSLTENPPRPVETSRPLPVESTARTTPDETSDKTTVAKTEEEPPPPVDPEQPEIAPKRILPAIPAEKKPATREIIAEFQKSLKKLRRATEAYELYEIFEKSYTFTDEERALVDREMAEWKVRADQNLVLLGREWVPQEQADAAAKDARHVLKQALAMLELGSFKECIAQLEVASRKDPNGIEADFTLGLMYSILHGFYDPELAEKHFRKVLARYPDHLSALNNLAVAQIKCGKFDPAVDNLKRVGELAPKCREVTQNAGRLITLAESKRLKIPDGVKKQATTLYSGLIASGKGKAADSAVGWALMPLYLPNTERRAEDKSRTAELVAWGQGTGFVVAPGYVVTNRHVVYDEEYDLGLVDSVRTRDPADPDGKRELSGKVLAVSDTHDLALVHFKDLNQPHLHLSTDPPKLAQEVMILGYPVASQVGSNLKAIAGRISGVPDAQGENLLFDAVANQGNSGGPVLDKSGRVVAVYTWVLTVGVDVRTQYGGGIAVHCLQPFLAKHLPDFRPGAPGGSEPADWTQTVSQVGPSVLKLDTYYRGGSPQMKSVVAQAEQGRSYLQDVSCPNCRGSGWQDCPQKGCIRGAISVKYVVRNSMRSPNAPGGVIYTNSTRVRKENCPTCSGGGKVSCPYCIEGIDLELVRNHRSRR